MSDAHNFGGPRSKYDLLVLIFYEVVPNETRNYEITQESGT